MGVRRSNQGFSLIEMAVVVVIAGLIMAGITSTYNTYMKERRIRVTHERLAKFQANLEEFYEKQGRFPCPADPTTPEDGTEKCGGAAFNVIGGNDTMYLGDGGTPDPVYTGAIPYETLRIGLEDINPDDGVLQSDDDVYRSSDEIITQREAVDDWGRLITYMVPEALTYKGSFKSSYVSINVENEFGDVLSNPAAAWVAFSHGNNGSGGYIADGGALSPIPCEGAEQANCNALSAVSDVTVINGLRNMVKGANYFDDIVYFGSINAIGYWGRARNDPVTAANPTASGSLASRDISNSNMGFVGIGNRNPVQRLDVIGGAKADKVKSVNVCTSDGASCFDISGLNAACPLGDALTSIQNGVVTCASHGAAGISLVDNSCAAGQYVIGVTIATGMPICGTP